MFHVLTVSDEASCVCTRGTSLFTSLHEMTEALAERMRAAATFYLEGIERALEHDDYLVGDDLTIADIAFACDLGQFLRERSMHASMNDPRFPSIAVKLAKRLSDDQAHLLSLAKKRLLSRLLWICFSRPDSGPVDNVSRPSGRFCGASSHC